MKRNFFLVACLIAATSVFAEDEAPKPWQWSGIVGLNANATGMVNWAAGGNNNIAGNVFGKVRLLYSENNLSWETNLEAEYGLTYVDQKFDKLQKSSDRLMFNTKFGWAFQPKWFLTVNAGFLTQFDLGRNYLGTGAPNPVISNILAPSYTDISVGFDYKPVDFFSLYLSPVAGRITTAYVSDKVNDRFASYLRDCALAADPTADVSGIEDYNLRQVLQAQNGTYRYDENVEKNAFDAKYVNAKASLGLTIKGTLNYTYKDLKLMSTLTLFTPYAWDKTKLYQYTDDNVYSEAQMVYHGYALTDAKYLGYRDNNQRFGNFDVDWTVSISYQFLKCLNVTLSTDLKYYNGVKVANKDGELAERVQFKSILGLGVGYSF